MALEPAAQFGSTTDVEFLLLMRTAARDMGAAEISPSPVGLTLRARYDRCSRRREAGNDRQMAGLHRGTQGCNAWQVCLQGDTPDGRAGVARAWDGNTP